MGDMRSATGISDLLRELSRTAVDAGQAIMKIYETDFAVAVKSDESPVTQADAAAEAIILADLARLLPDVPVIAEEEAAAGRIPRIGGLFLLVDPLDGTKEFVQRRDDFTVNIALIEDGSPSFGIVYAPAHRRLYCGDAVNKRAWTALVASDNTIGDEQPILVRPVPAGGLSAVASKSHNTPETDAYLAQFDVADIVSCGSSLKICMVAEGKADLYPRLAPTCEWDIAAGDAVLRAAGGQLLAPDGSPMPYGKPRFFNPGFVAAGSLSPPPIRTFLGGQA